MTENDVEYLKLQPKLFSFPDFKAGFDSGKKTKQETQDDFGTKSSGKESKVFEDGVKSVKVNYRRLYQQYPDLNKIGGWVGGWVGWWVGGLVGGWVGGWVGWWAVGWWVGWWMDWWVGW